MVVDKRDASELVGRAPIAVDIVAVRCGEMVESLPQPVRCFKVVGVELKSLLVDHHAPGEVG
jgi:hypothetical protein